MSKDTEIVAKVAQLERLKGGLRIAEEGASLMSATVCEYVPQLRAAEAARSSAEVASLSAKFQLQVVCVPESSLREELDQLQSNKTHHEDQCELEARRGSRALDLLYIASDTNRNFHENFQETRAQYDQ